MRTPANPNAVGGMPNATCESGRARPVPAPPADAGCAGGTNGVRLLRLTKNSPAMTTKTQMATLSRTSAFVTHDDSRMPTTATIPSTSTMSIAPTLTVDDSPNRDLGRCKASPR